MCVRVVHWYGVVEDSCRICIFNSINDNILFQVRCVVASW